MPVNAADDAVVLPGSEVADAEAAQRAATPPQTDVRFGSRLPVRILAWRRADGVRADAFVGDHAIVPLRFDLDLGGDGAARPGLARWSMARGLPLRRHLRDPFDVWLRETFRALRGALSGGEARHHWGPDDVAALSVAMRGVRAVARELAVHLADVCDPVARKAALRFPLCTRLWLHRRFAADPSGRLLQLADACPGALLLAFGAAEHGAEGTARTVLTGALSGRPLASLLGEAVERWAEYGRHEPEFHPHDPDLQLHGYFASLDAAGLRRALDDQRLLVRLAGRGVPPTLLVLPPPLAFAREDVPRGVRANALWYRVMKCSHFLTHPADPDETARRLALARFLSAQGCRAFAGTRHTMRIRHGVGDLVDYLRATGRRPGRRTDPARLFAESQRWHAQFVAPEEGVPLLPDPDYADRMPDDLPLPPVPVEGWRSPDGSVEVSALRTVGALRDESRTMSHCVASYVTQALLGRSFLYHASIAGEPVTIEITPRKGGHLTVGQARRHANAGLAPEHWQALAPWLEMVHAARIRADDPPVELEFDEIP